VIASTWNWILWWGNGRLGRREFRDVF